MTDVWLHSLDQISYENDELHHDNDAAGITEAAANQMGSHIICQLVQLNRPCQA